MDLGGDDNQNRDGELPSDIGARFGESGVGCCCIGMNLDVENECV